MTTQSTPQEKYDDLSLALSAKAAPKDVSNITLEDVLRAFQNTKWWNKISVSLNGQDDLADICFDDPIRECVYHMGKPLSEQPKKTIRLLHSLLL